MIFNLLTNVLLLSFSANIIHGIYHDGEHGCDYANRLRYPETNGGLSQLLAKGFSIAKNKQRNQQHKLEVYERNHEHVPVWGSVKRAKSSTAKFASCQGSGILETARLFAHQHQLTKGNAVETLHSIGIPQDLLNELTSDCQLTIFGSHGGINLTKPSKDCLYNRYRTATGVCNNPDHLTWGAALEPQQRLLPADYEDGFESPRGLSFLPNPRSISLALKERNDPPKSQRVSQMLKLWGQFMDHDIIRTPETSAGVDNEGETIDLPCCEEGTFEDVDFEDCLPITIPQEDIFFKNLNIQCLRFVRALPFSGNLLSPREQLSEITAFVDASTVYGSSKDEEQDLRTFHKGLLKVGKGKESSCTQTCPLKYLVESDDPDGDDHFLAGDDRINEQPSLASMHTIWLRLHNIIAKNLSYKYHHNDEIIYQEARKIVAALVQHITYTEFLPVVLGPKVMEKNGLKTPSIEHQDQFGYDTRYDVTLNPGVLNVFGAAAFRFGHTLVTNDMAGKVPFLLEENFFNGKLLRDPATHPSDILKNEFLSNAEGVDSVLNDVLTTKLMAREPFTHGSDLMSLNIMRGRDHGIPGYNQWRRVCGLTPFNSFDHMKEELDPITVNTFASLHSDVEDVDLFPAGLAENPVDDGILGPTFSCIISKQFFNLKHGDRFWYENGPGVHYTQGGALSPSQLRAVRKMSLAHVLCLTTSISSVTVWPMQVPGCGGGMNHLVSCKDLLRDNLIRQVEP